MDLKYISQKQTYQSMYNKMLHKENDALNTWFIVIDCLLHLYSFTFYNHLKEILFLLRSTTIIFYSKTCHYVHLMNNVRLLQKDHLSGIQPLSALQVAL